MTQPSQVTAAPPAEPVRDLSRRLNGCLVRIHPSGYGFIRPENGGIEYFINITDFPDRAAWNEGQSVSFKPGPQKYPGKAPRALNVILLK